MRNEPTATEPSAKGMAAAAGTPPVLVGNADGDAPGGVRLSDNGSLRLGQ